jgi:hypothetical protein
MKSSKYVGIITPRKLTQTELGEALLSESERVNKTRPKKPIPLSKIYERLFGNGIPGR